MSSRALRLIVAVLAIAVMGGAGAYLMMAERQTEAAAAAVRVFDLKARELSDVLADVRSHVQGYVGSGQNTSFWAPKMAAALDDAAKRAGELRTIATVGNSKVAVDEAKTSIGELVTIDKRVRDYLKSGDALMAADIVYTEAIEAAANAARQVEGARVVEHQSVDAAAAAMRKIEVMVVGACAVVVALLVLLLVPLPAPEPMPIPRIERPAPPKATIVGEDDIPDLPPSGFAFRPAAKAVAEPKPAPAPPAGPSPELAQLKAAATLCADFSRVTGVPDLQQLVGRLAEIIKATGVIVWVGDSAGADLKPVLAHGYTANQLAKIPAVPRDADNAAAAAYRTGTPQLVSAKAGSTGAIVAPLVSPDGCIGALSAELKKGDEAAEGTQALTAIFAAQLAGILNPQAPAEPEPTPASSDSPEAGKTE